MTKISINSSGLNRAASISPRREPAPQPLSDKAGPHPVLLVSRVDLLIVILSSLCLYPTTDSVEPGPDCKRTLMINRFWSEGINTPTGCQPASTVSKMSNEIQDKHSHTSVSSGGLSLNNRNRNSSMLYLFKTLWHLSNTGLLSSTSNLFQTDLSNSDCEEE